MKKASVELIIPGLFKLPLYELDATFLERDLPSLNFILRYAKRVKNKTYELEPMLAESIGLAGDQNLALAHAFVEESSSNDGCYLLCCAVHLKPDMRNAIVLSLDNLMETNNGITLIIKELNDYFNVDCHIKLISDKLWLMRVKRCEVPDIYPHYLSVLGRKADQYMEQSKQMLPWYQLINEIQMFMHTHEINQQRLEKGLLPINSLWCWGGGQLPELGKNTIKWYTSDLLLRRFAEKLEISNSGLESIADAEVRNHTVCIELSILETLKSVRDEDLKRLLGRIEQQLFKPLVQQIKSRKITLKLRAGYEFDFLLSAFSPVKFWKKAQCLNHFGVE